MTLKHGFFIILVLLIAATALTYISEPEAKSDRPILYWMTDYNPARLEQVRLFNEWMIRNGHVTPEGKPVFELRLDMVNQRKIGIQAVSGVAGDLMDIQVPFSQPVGYLHDVTKQAKELGFDLSKTYDGLEPLLAADGRQYGFPCNASVNVYWANVDAFERVGMEPPPLYWDFDTFERIGKEFVKRSNTPGQRQKVFFGNGMVDWFGDALTQTMMRSTGLDVMNETMTRCMIDDPRYALVLGRIAKWVREDHLFPSASDEASLTGGVDYQGMASTAGLNSLLNSGQIGMLNTGRWAMIRIRAFKNPANFTVAQLPCDEFNNALLQSRPAVIYKLSPHKDDFAPLFLAFLASKEYNEHISENSDALPPCPEYTQTELFLRPKGHENEWRGHAGEAEIAATLGISQSFTPYASVGMFQPIRKDALDEVMLGLSTPQKAAEKAARRSNALFGKRLEESPPLKARYLADVELQKKIEQYRAEGRKVPLEWLKNPFHKKYYVHKGWAEAES